MLRRTTTYTVMAEFFRRTTKRISSALLGETAQNRRTAILRIGQAPKSGSPGKVVPRFDVRGEASRLKRLDQPPAQIDLAWKKAHLRRTRKGVMVVVPAFAHADQSCELDVVSLSCRAIDDPALSALAMGEMADQPMAGNADA